MSLEELPKDALVLLVDADTIPYSIGNEMKKWQDYPALTDSLTADYMNNLLKKVGASHLIGFVGGKGNFRYEIAVSKPYKANRDTNERNTRYKQVVSEYLVQQFNFIRVNGIEADDAISITANLLEKAGINYLIASNDKDLDQVTGNHCKFDMSGPTRFYHIDEWEAAKFLAGQLIMGDATDNIPGLPGRGLKAAASFRVAHDNTNKNKDIQEIVDDLLVAYSHYGIDYFQEQLALLGLLTDEEYPHIDLELDFTTIDQQKILEYKSQSESLKMQLALDI